MVQQKLLYHALRPKLEAPEVSPAARAQYLTFGGTELSLAALRGEEDMVKVLLESGAADVPDCMGVTAVYQVGGLKLRDWLILFVIGSTLFIMEPPRLDGLQVKKLSNMWVPILMRTRMHD